MMYDTLLTEHNGYTTLITMLNTAHDPGLGQCSHPYNPPTVRRTLMLCYLNSLQRNTISPLIYCNHVTANEGTNPVNTGSEPNPGTFSILNTTQTMGKALT
jgi:hypothetical protein